MKSGDFVSIDYIGKVKDTGEIFDVTVEEAAKKNNVYNPKVSYRPINVVVDANFIIKGIDDALKEMEVGDKKMIVVEPDKAFGERNPDFVRPIPLSNFKGEKVDPQPGAYVEINGMRGKILSVDGGRIRVDFNHPLAGKKLEYEIEVKREITEPSEKVKAVVGYLTGAVLEKIQANISGNGVELRIELEKNQHDLHGEQKKHVADTIMKWVGGLEKVRFVDEYSAESNSEGKKD